MRTQKTVRMTAAVVAAMAVGLASCGGSSADDTSSGTTTTAPTTTTTVPPEYETPIVFVHGFLGSGAQYRTEALRWASNGFPAERIRAYDYGTGSTGLRQGLPAAASNQNEGLGTFLENVRKEFNVEKVRLVGHSLGTFVLTTFMRDQTLRAGVDKWVLVDGLTCPADDTTCLAIRASDMGQTHVEAATSAESFTKQHTFFTGKDPKTTKVEPGPSDDIEIAGKVLHLQINTAPENTTGEVWEVTPATGARVGSDPVGTFTVAADGSFGPVKVKGTKHYEIALSKPGSRSQHIYNQPFIRSDHILRLLTVEPTSETAQNTNVGPNHSALVISRYQEWWVGKGEKNDRLELSANGQAPVDILAPFSTLRSPDGVIGIHIHDDTATPGQTTSAILDWFKDQGFQTGVDVFMPAANPPTGTIKATVIPRGDTSKPQTLVAPNWPSSTDAISFTFNDYAQ